MCPHYCRDMFGFSKTGLQNQAIFPSIIIAITFQKKQRQPCSCPTVTVFLCHQEVGQDQKHPGQYPRALVDNIMKLFTKLYFSYGLL